MSQSNQKYKMQNKGLKVCSKIDDDKEIEIRELKRKKPQRDRACPRDISTAAP